MIDEEIKDVFASDAPFRNNNVMEDKNSNKSSSFSPLKVNGKKDCFRISEFINSMSDDYEIADKYCTLDDFINEDITIIDWKKTDRQTRFGKDAYQIIVEYGDNCRRNKIFTGARVVIQELKDIEKVLMASGQRTVPFRCRVIKQHHGYKLVEPNRR